VASIKNFRHSRIHRFRTLRVDALSSKAVVFEQTDQSKARSGATAARVRPRTQESA
jgi:hypothetical protein